jgi:hypothetical protein
MIAQQKLLFIGVGYYTIFVSRRTLARLSQRPPAEARRTRMRLGNGAVRH